MRKIFLVFVFALLIQPVQMSAQSGYVDSLTTIVESDQHDTLRIRAALNMAQHLEMSDYEGARKSALWALHRSKDIGYDSGVYDSYYAMASMHYENSMAQLMLQYIDSMMAMESVSITDEQQGDAYNLLGIAHYTNGDLVQAIEAWKSARELLPDNRQSGVISNIGNIYLSSEEKEKALGWFLEAAALNERDKVYHYLAMNYYNIASCYPNSDTLHLYYLDKCIENARIAGYTRMVPAIYSDYVRYYSDNQKLSEAAAILDSLNMSIDGLDSLSLVYYRDLAWSLYRESLARELLAEKHIPSDLPEAGRLPMDLLRDAADQLAQITDETDALNALFIDNQRLGFIYQTMGEYQKSAERFRLSLQYKDTIAVNKAQFILKQYERDQEAAAEMEASLRRENEQQKQRYRFFATLAGGCLMLFLAIGLWSRLRFTRRTNSIILREKERSEELLLNILPEEVAEELKEKGAAEAQLIDEVTVLFTDFKGFTALSEQLSPKALVDDLNECFSEFDRITAKYGIEKIKTIGDSYMAAGGLPTPNNTHAFDVIRAAFEMIEFVENGKKKKQQLGLPFFEIRIGVHTGPVVAGIVGVKKFQYDIWGDTVNTASRMETACEVGQVNISQATYEIVQNRSEFTFDFRGKIEARGKGEMEMYFVQKKLS